MFSRAVNAREGSAHSTIVRQSREYVLPGLSAGFEDTDPRSLLEQVEKILRIVVQMILTQKETISSQCPDLISEDTQSHLKFANDDETARKRLNENKGGVDSEEDDSSA